MKLLPIVFLLLFIVFSNNITAQQQPENPGFEFWEEFGIGPDTLEPVDWSSLKSSDGGDLINMVIPQVWEQTTDAHSGMYAVKLINMPILTLVAPGTLTNGRVHATLPPTDAYVYTIDEDPQWHTTFTDMPDSLTAWAKYFPESTDIAHIIAVLHTDTAKIFDTTQTNWVAVANIDISEQVTDWTRFSVPFTYLNNDTPEFILFGIFVGDAENSTVGSTLYLDDIELIYYNTGQESISREEIEIFFRDSELIVNLDYEISGDDSNLEIYDLSGRKIWSEKFTASNSNRFKTNLKSGTYICKISNAEWNFTQKIIKR
jgi:hypothetical protein